MKNQQIRLAMVKLDGLEPSGEEKIPFRRIDTKVFVSLDTDYVKSHNAVQRVVDGLSEKFLRVYYETLWCVVGLPLHEEKILKASPAQKCEAVLKAKGLWVD